MFTRRKLLSTASIASASLIVAGTIPAPLLAKESDISAAEPSKSRGPILTFLGGSSSAAVTRAIIARINAHPTRQVTAIGDRAFLDELSLIVVEPKGRLSLVGVGPDIPDENANRNLIATLRNDPDELIFQSPEVRFIGTTARAPARDQLSFAWATGHHVTCGVVAANVQDMHSQVSSALNTWRYGVYSRNVEAIDVKFEDKDTSSRFRHAFLADPVSNILWASDVRGEGGR